jgi:hypothetical protein
MTQHEHEEHDHSVEGHTHGIALGFRILDFRGELYFAEAEISAYVDEPDSLGATLVFHKVSGIDPTAGADEIEWPTWATDVDEDLTRDASPCSGSRSHRPRAGNRPRKSRAPARWGSASGRTRPRAAPSWSRSSRADAPTGPS